MFKSRKVSFRKRRGSRQIADRANDNQCKLEGNSNITSNRRVTMPPSFLGLKEGFNADIETGNQSITEIGNIHEVDSNNINDNHRQLRHSSRIFSKPKNTSNYNSNTTAFEYYSQGLKHKPGDYQSDRKFKKTPFASKSIVRTNSKSLFQQINEQYSRVKSKGTTNFNYPLRAVVESSSRVKSFSPISFCLSVSKEVLIDLNQTDYLSQSKLAISEKVRNINAKLCGEMDHRDSPKRKSLKRANDETESAVFRFVPKCDWVYLTPPSQKVVLPRAEECLIQPAVICTTKKQSNIYELHPSFKMDFTDYSNREHIPVDKRYLKHVARFEENTTMDLDLGELPDNDHSYFRDEIDEDQFAVPSTISQYFSQVTARPTKTVKKLCRINSFSMDGMRSNEESDTTPTGGNLFQSIEGFERDFTFVADEDGYKIVTTQNAVCNENLNFKFRKNLFKNDKMFDFDKDESKMFDFSQIGKKDVN